jgi:hypothetical protein
MREVSKGWIAVVTAALLLSALAGAVWARPNDSPQAADITRRVTLTGADFAPNQEGMDWGSDGGHVNCNTVECTFTAPVVFPCLPAVTVERIKLHVYDGNASSTASAGLWRANPSTGGETFWASVGSPLGMSGGDQTYTSADINKVVWPSQRAYIWLQINGTDIKVYGITVEYHRNI